MPSRGDGLALLEHQVLPAEGETECAEFSEKIALREPRIISTKQNSCRHKNAANEAAVQEIVISFIDEFS